MPAGLPPFTWPMAELSQLTALLPVAVAATVLSLVESSAVARSIATESGQRLDMNREFVGLGLDASLVRDGWCRRLNWTLVGRRMG